MKPVKKAASLITAATVLLSTMSAGFPVLAKNEGRETENPVQAAVYVSPDGDDKNDGTKASPFQTLERARDEVRKINDDMTGDIIVYLEDGRYTLRETFQLGLEDSGTNGYNIVYRAEEGAEPVISGAYEVPASAWTQTEINGVDGYVMDASMIEDTRHFYVNGERQQRARGEDRPAGFGYQHLVGFSIPTTGKYADMASWRNIRNIEIVTDSMCTGYRGGIDKIENGVAVMKQPYFYEADKFSNCNNVTWVENAYELLDEPGEWYLDQTEKKLYYIPKAGVNMETADILIPTVENLVEGVGYSGDVKIKNIVFDGITFSYNTWLRTNSDLGYADAQAGTVRNIKTDGASDAPLSVDYFKLDNIVVEAEDCDFFGVPTYGDVEVREDPYASGGKYVGELRKANQEITADTFEQDYIEFTAPCDSNTLTLGYATDTYGKISLVINDVHERDIYIFNTGAFFGEGSWAEKIENVKIKKGDTVRLEQSSRQWTQTKEAGVVFKIAENIGVYNCRFTALGTKGVVLTDMTSDSEVIGNTFTDISHSGIDFGDFGSDNNFDNAGLNDFLIPDNQQPQNIIIKNNFIDKIGVEYHSGIGIAGGYSKNCEVSHNWITDVPYTAMSIGYGWGAAWGDESVYSGNNRMEYNYVNNCMQILNDGGAIYTLGPQRGTLMQYNYVANQVHQYAALYLDNGTAGMTVQKNVVYNTPSFGFIQCYNPVAYNNYMGENYSNCPLMSNTNKGSGNKFGNNITVQDQWPQEAYDIIANAGLEPQYAYLAEECDDVNELRLNIAEGTTGNLITDDKFSEGKAEKVEEEYLQIDLSKNYDLNRLQMWRDFLTAKTYRDTVVLLSTTEDFTENVTTVYNNDRDNSLGLGYGLDYEYQETIGGNNIVFSSATARYIRIYSGGSDQNAENLFVEVKAFGRESKETPVGKNLILGMTPTTSNPPTLSHGTATDGERDCGSSGEHNFNLPDGVQWMQFDLGEKCLVNRTDIYLYWHDDRKYRLVVQFSNDPTFQTDVTTVLNTDTQNTIGQGAGTDEPFVNTPEGKSVTFNPIEAQYVRLWINGFTKDDGTEQLWNGITEFEVYGIKNNEDTDSKASNVLPGSLVSTSNPPIARLGLETDGNKICDETGLACYQPDNDLQWTQYDLKAPHEIDGIGMWYYYNPNAKDESEYRINRDIIVQLSNDPEFKEEVVTVYNNDQDNSAGQGIGTDEEFKATPEGKQISFEPVTAQYIRFWVNGFTSENGSEGNWNNVLEYEAYGVKSERPIEKNNILQGVQTDSKEAVTSGLGKETDGSKDSGEMMQLKDGVQYTCYDLGKRMNIDGFAMWYDTSAQQAYEDVIVQFSETADFSDGVYTVYNSDRDNTAKQGFGRDEEILATLEGKTVVLEEPIQARYVRFWLNSSEGANKVVEYEVYGSAAEDPVPEVYGVKVNGELIGEYEEGAEVTITANPAETGSRFTGWTAEGLELTEEQKKAETLTFIMPSNEVSLTASYETIPEEVDKSLLRDAYEYALTLDTDGVAEDAVKYFEKVLEEAKAVLDNENATQEEVDITWDNLLEAIWGLGIVQGDKRNLEKLIAKAESMLENEEKYVSTHWHELLDALKEAKQVMSDENALEEDVKATAEALHQAILDQRYKANKENLQELIDKADKIDLSQYTAESVAVFKASLKAANQIMADESLSEDNQAVVDQAVKDLSRAIEGLELISDSSGESEGSENESGNETQSPDDSDNGSGNESQNPDNSEGSNSPTTGDTRVYLEFVSLAIVSLIMLGVLYWKKKKVA